ncbi:hypothetical protein BKA70DRAFT_482848 [Coprinopsis sp. MPI-PUGE-AT-0042]|nr:hypothetical protein BKA70DRAFT_482848 [Coprinopsis sp. MPI-PUGE-AT-0042]
MADSEGQSPPAGVVMFDKSTAQTFYNSSFAAAGRDHVTVNVAVGTASQPPSPPARKPTKPDPSIITGFFRGFSRSRKRSRSQRTSQDLPDTGCTTASSIHTTQPVPSTPSPPVRPSLCDVAILSDGSSLSSIDSPSNSPQPRPCASSEEEVYERSFLPKGQGHPMYNPSPLGGPAKPGDVGIITPDGFEPFGNLFVPEDQEKFCIDSPPKVAIVRQSEKFKQGQTLVIGMEHAKGLAHGGKESNTSFRFEFHCREAQGAVLAFTSSAILETLSAPSKNELKRYLCCHGKQLMANLRDKYYLESGDSLYVVTGTVKSDSWGIAVHTSPMREPNDCVVLTRRTDLESGGDGNPDAYEWTSRGKAEARYGETSSIDNSGQRTKDQCLFLRGFLITPSPKSESPSHQGGKGDSSAGNPSSGSDSPDPGDRKAEAPKKEGERKHKGSKDSSGSSSTNSAHYQLHDTLDPHVVIPFPSVQSKCSRVQNYYPSQRINETLLRDAEADLAITHDDDWRLMIEDRYLDDDSLTTLTKQCHHTRLFSVCNGVASMTLVPVFGSAPGYPSQTTSLPCVLDTDSTFQRELVPAAEHTPRALSAPMAQTHLPTGWERARIIEVVPPDMTLDDMTPDMTPDTTPFSSNAGSPSLWDVQESPGPEVWLDTDPNYPPPPSIQLEAMDDVSWEMAQVFDEDASVMAPITFSTRASGKSGQKCRKRAKSAKVASARGVRSADPASSFSQGGGEGTIPQTRKVAPVTPSTLGARQDGECPDLDYGMNLQTRLRAREAERE